MTSPEWETIKADNRVWFSKATMEFWHTVVLWESLTPIGDAWLFISQDRDYANNKSYSIRKATVGGGVDTLSFQQTSDRDEAFALLNDWSGTLGTDK
jgi:hypothetical protein